MCLPRRGEARFVGGLLSLRTVSVGLSMAAALLVVALACMPSYSGPHPGDAFLARAQEAGFSPGDPVMIRIFKRESQFELWMRKDDRFELVATYPICYWSGKLGPKEREGDRQAPRASTPSRENNCALAGAIPFPSTSAFPMRSIGRWDVPVPISSCTAAARPSAALP